MECNTEGIENGVNALSGAAGRRGGSETGIALSRLLVWATTASTFLLMGFWAVVFETLVAAVELVLFVPLAAETALAWVVFPEAWARHRWMHPAIPFACWAANAFCFRCLGYYVYGSIFVAFCRKGVAYGFYGKPSSKAADGGEAEPVETHDVPADGTEPPSETPSAVCPEETAEAPRTYVQRVENLIEERERDGKGDIVLEAHDPRTDSEPAPEPAPESDNPFLRDR